MTTTKKECCVMCRESVNDNYCNLPDCKCHMSTHNTREGIEEFKKDFDRHVMVDKTGFVYVKKAVLYEMIDRTLHQELQKARDEALAREKQLKQLHMMELDAISCMSLEQYVAWRDHRKQRPNQSELNQPTASDKRDEDAHAERCEGKY